MGSTWESRFLFVSFECECECQCASIAFLWMVMLSFEGWRLKLFRQPRASRTAARTIDLSDFTQELDMPHVSEELPAAGEQDGRPMLKKPWSHERSAQVTLHRRSAC